MDETQTHRERRSARSVAGRSRVLGGAAVFGLFVALARLGIWRADLIGAAAPVCSRPGR